MPRQTAYMDSVADRILERMADGESLHQICRDADMPAIRTVLYWVRLNPEFADAYMRAQEVRADTIFDEMLDIADDGRNDFVKRTQNGHEVDVVDQEHIARSRLRVEARKWVLSKMAPKRFADRLSVDSTSEVTVREAPMGLSALSADERDTMRALILKARAAAETATSSMQASEDRLHNSR